MSNSGWTNDAVDTLTVPTGATTGQRVVIGNLANGDAIDVYDASNRLVLEVTGTGALVTTDQPAQDTVTVAGNGIQFQNVPSPSAHAGNIIGLSNSTDSSLQLDSGNGVAGFGDSLLTLVDATFPGAGGSSAIKVDQRGTVGSLGVEGTLVQTDSFGTGNNVVHGAVYSITTDASGNSTFNHGCNFTPVGGFLSCNSVAGVDFYQYVWLNPPFTGTTASAHFASRTGANVANATVTAYAWFFG